MNAFDLFRLGRWFTKLGEEAMRPAGSPVTAPGARLILMDVFANPESSIGEIAKRTGLPQSYVSESVAQYRSLGAFDTWSDPLDGRRTLVKVNDSVPATIGRLGAVSVDGALLEAFDEPDTVAASALLAGLEDVERHVRRTLGSSGAVRNTEDQGPNRP